MLPHGGSAGRNFPVLGAFRLIHKLMFDAFVGSDPPLVWLTIMFLILTTALAFVGPVLAHVSFAVAVAMFMAFAMVGRWESVMIWTTDGPDQQRRIGPSARYRRQREAAPAGEVSR